MGGGGGERSEESRHCLYGRILRRFHFYPGMKRGVVDLRGVELRATKLWLYLPILFIIYAIHFLPFRPSSPHPHLSSHTVPQHREGGRSKATRKHLLPFPFKPEQVSFLNLHPSIHPSWGIDNLICHDRGHSLLPSWAFRNSPVSYTFEWRLPTQLMNQDAFLRLDQ